MKHMTYFLFLALMFATQAFANNSSEGEEGGEEEVARTF